MKPRIRVKESAPEINITHNETGAILGVFVPGLGYWITPENSRCAHEMVSSGFADYEDASAAPLASTGSIDLAAAEGQVAGFLEIGN